MSLHSFKKNRVRFFCVICFLFLIAVEKTEAQFLFNVAGSGSAGYTGDNGPAYTAQLNSPGDIFVDSNGRIFFADMGNNVVRMIDKNGIIKTVAGNGYFGYGGDGGLATAASLRNPSGVCVDEEGNLYIADLGNHRIRMVSPSGIIYTVAGTGDEGYSADGVEAENAKLSYPYDVVVDRPGIFYFSEYGNNCVRRVDVAGVLSTVAGSPSAGFSGDGGKATSAKLSHPVGIYLSGSSLYITDFGNNRIRKVDENGIISTVAGILGTVNYLYQPHSVLVNSAGDILIADTANHVIRKVAASGKVELLAGTGVAGDSGFGSLAIQVKITSPWGIATDPNGNIYITDKDTHRVLKIDFPLSSDAGLDQTVPIAVPATLTGKGQGGSGNYTYSWDLISGPLLEPSQITRVSSDTIHFTPYVQGTFIFRLTVFDGSSTASDTVTITATAPLYVEAGPGRFSYVGKPVSLKGKVGGGAGNYTVTWSVAAGPEADPKQFQSIHALETTFTPDSPGSYVLRLSVDDSVLSSQSDMVNLNVLSANQVSQVSVTDSLLTTEDLSSSVDSDYRTSRALVIRWLFSSTLFNADDVKDIHVYVRINNETDYHFLGRTNDGSAEYLQWRTNYKVNYFDKAYYDGPQFGNSYQFQVYLLTQSGVPVFYGPYTTSGSVLFLESSQLSDEDGTGYEDDPNPPGSRTPTPTLTATPTATFTLTPTFTIIPTPTQTPTLTPTPTGSITPTPSATPTVTMTPSATWTPTFTYTPSITQTPTFTKTPTVTPIPSRTGTPTATFTPRPGATIQKSPSPTPTIFGGYNPGPTNTPTIGSGWTPYPYPTATLTQTPTPTETATPSMTPTASVTPLTTWTPLPTWTPEATWTPASWTPIGTWTPLPTWTAGVTWTPVATWTPTATGTATATFTATATWTPTFTATATPWWGGWPPYPTATFTPTFTGTPGIQPTLAQTPSITPSATGSVTPSGTITPTLTRTPTITMTPFVTPTATRTVTPTFTPVVSGYTPVPIPTGFPSSPTPWTGDDKVVVDSPNLLFNFESPETIDYFESASSDVQVALEPAPPSNNSEVFGKGLSIASTPGEIGTINGPIVVVGKHPVYISGWFYVPSSTYVVALGAFTEINGVQGSDVYTFRQKPELVGGQWMKAEISVDAGYTRIIPFIVIFNNGNSAGSVYVDALRVDQGTSSTLGNSVQLESWYANLWLEEQYGLAYRFGNLLYLSKQSDKQATRFAAGFEPSSYPNQVTVDFDITKVVGGSGVMTLWVGNGASAFQQDIPLSQLADQQVSTFRVAGVTNQPGGPMFVVVQIAGTDEELIIVNDVRVHEQALSGSSS